MTMEYYMWLQIQFCDAERGTYKQSGAGGGTPFKLGQPTQLEELALAYLGIDKVYGE